MAAFSTIFAGIGAASAAGGGLFSLFGNKGQKDVGAISSHENLLKQQQMNLEATRRTRDVIRNSQIATANSENMAYQQGAGNSSGLVGVESSISGNAATNIQGIEQNRDFGNSFFEANTWRANALGANSASRARAEGLQGFLGAMGKLGGTAGRLADLGWGSASNFFGSHNWDNNNDISQVGSQY